MQIMKNEIRFSPTPTISPKSMEVDKFIEPTTNLKSTNSKQHNDNKRRKYQLVLCISSDSQVFVIISNYSH